MNINSPYYFQTRIKERAPYIFLTENEDKTSSYSRLCPSNIKRQPVLLNEDELNEINKNYPNYLQKEDILKYEINKKDSYYFICPRYWCLLTNSFISEEEVKSGKCGGIIPESAKKVPKGKYVYEFRSNEKEHGTFNNYIKHYPGFTKKKTADGHCIPCCFKKWNTPEQLSKRKECGSKQENEEEIKENKKEDALLYGVKEKREKKVKDISENYIKGPEKFPLEQSRWGYLPISIQKFFHEFGIDCQISNMNTNIKLNHTCLLRHGVENNKNQSFISCIADASYYPSKDVPTIVEMKKIIKQSLNIDIFITIQNGNLVNDFSIKKNEYPNKINLDSYKNSKFYSNIDKTNEKQLSYFENIIYAYENFLNFLDDDTITIDYTYLWDFICMENDNIFKYGVNLIILEVMDNDSTNNVQLICPTNHNLSTFYESRKSVLLLIKRDNIFEPIYSYRNEEKKIIINTTFNEYNKFISKPLKTIIQKIIKPTLIKTCKPLESIMPQIYKFEQPIQLNNLVILLNKFKYEIIKQIINFSNNKVIGILCKKNKVVCFIPCYPSSILYQYIYGYITDDDIINNYNNTFYFLNKLYEITKGEIPCKPAFKILEDQVIIGFLTKSNQFVEVIPTPITEINDDIEILNDNNYNKVDVDIFLNNEKDEERINFIKKINLETNLYNAFTNTIRVLINKYENIEIRENIESQLIKKYLTYNEKLENIFKNIKIISHDKIIFLENFNYQLISEVSICINKNKNKCIDNPLCIFTQNNICQLILPKINLINNNDNETFYFYKLTDQLIRNFRIRTFILQPDFYFSLSQINYKINNNEIIMLQSLLTSEYFDKLVIYQPNKYTNYNDYDNAQPLLSQFYSNQINIDKLINKEENYICNTNITNINLLFLKKCFDNKMFKSINYSNTIFCGYLLIIDIIKKIKSIDISFIGIKKILYEKYNFYIKNNKQNIFDILSLQGKKSLTDQIKSNNIKLDVYIYNDLYFITNLDIQIIMEYYKIPTILLSNKPLIETNYQSNFLIINNTELTDFEYLNYIFIIVPPPRPEVIPIYKLISFDDNILINLRKVNENCLNNIISKYKDINVDFFIQNFKKINKPKNILKNYKKSPIRLIIEEDTEELEEIQQEPQEEIQEELQEEPQEELQEEPQEELQQEPQEEIQEEIQEELQQEPQEELQQEPQEEPQEELQEEPQEELQQEPQEEIQEELQEEPQEEPQEEIQEELQEELQQEQQEEPQEEPQEKIKKEIKKKLTKKKKTKQQKNKIIDDKINLIIEDTDELEEPKKIEQPKEVKQFKRLKKNITKKNKIIDDKINDKIKLIIEDTDEIEEPKKLEEIKKIEQPKEVKQFKRLKKNITKKNKIIDDKINDKIKLIIEDTDEIEEPKKSEEIKKIEQPKEVKQFKRLKKNIKYNINENTEEL